MTNLPHISYSMKGAVEATGLSRSTLDRAIRTGKLRAHRTSEDEDGNPVGSFVIPADALRDFIEGLPAA